MSTATGLSGLLHKADPGRVLSMRKYALTMGTVLQRYANQQEMISQLEAKATEFILLDYPRSSSEVLDFIADVLDALTTKRPYKEPWPLDRAFTLLIDERGKRFDPALVDAFVHNMKSVE